MSVVDVENVCGRNTSTGFPALLPVPSSWAHGHPLHGAGAARMADRQDGHQVWPSRPGPLDSPTLPSPSIAILDVMGEMAVLRVGKVLSLSHHLEESCLPSLGLGPLPLGLFHPMLAYPE